MNCLIRAYDKNLPGIECRGGLVVKVKRLGGDLASKAGHFDGLASRTDFDAKRSLCGSHERFERLLRAHGKKLTASTVKYHGV